MTAALVLAACGDDGSSEPGDTGQGSTTTGGTNEVDDGQIDEDATVRVAWAGGTSGWDPLLVASATTSMPYLMAAYDALLGMNADGELEARLAEEWEYNDDLTELTLRLREGVVFQDGSTFDADAAKASLDRARELITPATRTPMDLIESVDVVDESTIQVNLASPDPALLNSLASYAGMMVSPAQVTSDNLNDSPAGAGPWTPLLDESTQTVVVYERFEDYWDSEMPRAARLEIHGIEDELTRLNAFASGQLDASIVFASGYTDAAAQAETSGSNLYAYPVPLSFGLYTNMATAPELENPDVRRALNMAIDRATLAERVLDGQCHATTQAIAPGVPGHVPEFDDLDPYDPDGARELLEQAGVSNLSLQLLIATNDPYPAIAQVIQEQWAQIGVELSVEQVPGAESYAAYRDRNFNFFMSNIPGGPVPVAALEEYINRGAFGNVPDELTEAVAAAKLLDAASDEGTQALEEINEGLIESPVHILVCRIVQNFLAAPNVVGGDALPWLRMSMAYDPRGLAIVRGE